MEHIKLAIAFLVFTETARYCRHQVEYEENGVWYVDTGYLIVCFVYQVLSFMTFFIVIRKLFF
jgi:hypothetical protein